MSRHVGSGPENPQDAPPPIRCSQQLVVTALPGLPVVRPGDALAPLITAALSRARLTLQDGDILVVASKLVSRVTDRFVDLATVTPSERAAALGLKIGQDARLVELILRESSAISRSAPGVLVVRHRLGFICANAGIDQSNALPSDPRPGTGPWVLLLPQAPDEFAETLRVALAADSGAAIGVVIADSFGRPFRLGTVGSAIGLAGLPALWDRRGEADLFGRRLLHTVTALGDQIAAVADLVAGQADEGRGVVHIRGLSFPVGAHTAAALCRPAEQDLYA